MKKLLTTITALILFCNVSLAATYNPKTQTWTDNRTISLSENSKVKFHITTQYKTGQMLLTLTSDNISPQFYKTMTNSILDRKLFIQALQDIPVVTVDIYNENNKLIKQINYMYGATGIKDTTYRSESFFPMTDDEYNSIYTYVIHTLPVIVEDSKFNDI